MTTSMKGMKKAEKTYINCKYSNCFYIYVDDHFSFLVIFGIKSAPRPVHWSMRVCMGIGVRIRVGRIVLQVLIQWARSILVLLAGIVLWDVVTCKWINVVWLPRFFIVSGRNSANDVCLVLELPVSEHFSQLEVTF